ncbi:MAG: futalosine hydrolase, partial [Phycisphaerales bacterium]|nr:futalosine hydrolase [Phycisphaerales bacterium]
RSHRMDSSRANPTAGPLLNDRGRALVAIASPKEALAILGDPTIGPDDLPLWTTVRRDRFDVVRTGVSKANAAAGAMAAFDGHQAILSVGIGGALSSDVGLGDLVLASSCVFADEGVEMHEGLRSCAELGFDIPDVLETDPSLRGLLRPHVDHEAPIATVSSGAGRDDLARRRASIASVEAMEGAAVALVAHRLGVPFAEIRAVSNTTGDRSAQVWEIDRALDRLRAFVALL